MADVHPTPTRRALLADIAAGRITRTTDNGRCFDWSGREVTARMSTLARAGWIALAPVPPEQRRAFVADRQWTLTETGRAVLATAPSTPDGRA